MESIVAFIKYLKEDGIWVLLIITVGIFSYSICIERMYSIMYRFNINGKELMAKLKKNILANKLNNAIAICDRKPTASLARIFKAALINADKPSANIQKAVDDVSLEEVQGLMRRTPYLPGFANVATLLGLLGTINGLINSFQSLGSANPEDRQTLLAAGISMAMQATFYGLVVAIPTLLFYSIIQNKTTALIDDIDRYSAKVVDLLVQHRTNSEILTVEDKTRAVSKDMLKKTKGKTTKDEQNEDSIIELLEDDSE